MDSTDRRNSVVKTLGRSRVPESPILYNLRQAMDAARTLWPQALEESPMAAPHKEALRTHWKALQPDFRIEV